MSHYDNVYVIFHRLLTSMKVLQVGSFFTGYKDYNIDIGTRQLLCHTGDPIKTSHGRFDR